MSVYVLLFSACLSFLVGVNDVTFSRHCRAGVLLKTMDECAGIVAAKHCQTNVVTACLNATNFYKMIPIGNAANTFISCLKTTFSALPMLVGRHREHPACKKFEWLDASMVVMSGAGCK